MKKLTIAMAALLACGAAQAHYLWLESGEAGAKLYFGEAEALLKEPSPGKLDNIKGPQAFVVDAGGKQSAAVMTRAADHIAVSGKAASHVVAEESLEVRDLQKHGLGIAKTNYYARSGQPANGASVLPLDVQAQEADSFTVLYRGQPLKGAKLEVIAPNTWIQEHTTDARGVVRINAPWRGQYVLHVLHVDKTPGEFGNAKFDNVRSHFTYTFVRSEGADPGPAVPPKHPME
ncbi:DUF4198 domain-containing protein [Noviherbaspirillum sp.]|uniref:DUF4198 domain-containing protein n=1 Tax=Noviherbaspirillum sp. TaxID=1926288 RepID=UPI002D4BDBF1|nr:DUF4198 domain-containing protein [Noviherbaspirillum sp.]HZW23449.1 DUF4198 domain-containing protein [Noviherbaspirillum sp.]